MLNKNSNTASRLNRAKNQYENILLGLHLPTDEKDAEVLFPSPNHSSRNLGQRQFLQTEPESFEGDEDVEDIIVNQQVEIPTGSQQNKTMC
jgi:hypothetical protein